MNEPPEFGVLDEFQRDLPVRGLLIAFGDPMARYAFYYVSQESEVSLDRLAEVVTGWTNAASGALASRADRDRKRLQLYHVHLPILDSLGLVDFDAESRTVQIAPHSPQLNSFLEWLSDLEHTSG